MNKEIQIPMDWIRIPFPVSLAEDLDSNPLTEGFDLLSKKGQNVCLKRWIRIPYTTNLNPNSNKVCLDDGFESPSKRFESR